MREKLTRDDIEQLASHAGELAKQIQLKSVARSEAAKAAKREIDGLNAELGAILDWLRTGYREVHEQSVLPFADSRLDDCRDVVRQTKSRLGGAEEAFGDD